MKPATGNPEADELHQAAQDVAKKMEDESGMKVINDADIMIHWEEAYQSIVQDNDQLTETPSGTPSGPRLHEVGSIIELSSSDSESLQAHTKTKAMIKQEVDDAVIPEKNTKGKGVARPAKDVSRSKNVVAKTYRHGDGKVTGKTTAAEKVLGTLADHLSPETQVKKDANRMELAREFRDQDRRDRMFEERERTLNKMIEDLKQETNTLRERAVVAETRLHMVTNPTRPAPIPPTYPTSVHLPTLPAFASGPGYYSPGYYEVPHTIRNDPEFEGVAGPSSQTTRHYEGGAGTDGDGIFETE